MHHRSLGGLSAAIAAAGVWAGGCAPEAADHESADIYAKNQLISEVRLLAADNEVTPVTAAPEVRDELFVLGQALAFDKILSGNENISCMTCHHSLLGTDDDRHLSLGEGGTGLGADREGGHIIPRNAPALFNLHAMPAMFWDGRVEIDDDGVLHTPAGDEITPEMEAVFEFGVASAQAMFPVTSPEEMAGMPGTNEIADAQSNTELWERLMDRLGDIPEYVDMFEAAYPGTSFEEMTFAHAANAIAGFEIRAFEATGSPWQEFLRGDDDALSFIELRGARDFFIAGCATCHSGPMFTDFDHHNTALAQFGPGKGDGPTGHDDFGREQVTGDPADRYAFKTPTLHNVELTAPYGHTGQFKDLRQFIDHYVEPAEKLLTYDITEHVSENESFLWDTQVDNLDDVLATMSPLTEVQLERVENLRTFLEALTDPASTDLAHTIPESVPSGLPVED